MFVAVEKRKKVQNRARKTDVADGGGHDAEGYE